MWPIARLWRYSRTIKKIKNLITMTETVREVQKRYCSRAMVIAICVALVLILIGFKPVGKGLVLGSMFSIINFILIGATLPLKIDPSRRKAAFLSFLSICLRYLLLAIPLVIAVKQPQFDLTAAVIGIFMIQLVILAEHGFRYFTSNRKRIRDY